MEIRIPFHSDFESQKQEILNWCEEFDITVTLKQHDSNGSIWLFEDNHDQVAFMHKWGVHV